MLRTGESRNRDWTWLTSDGRRIVVDHTTSRIVDPSGQVTGFLTVAEDVTQRREADLATAQALAREREAVEELTALDRTKTDFLSAVSHELRTPLASVLGYTELLEDGGAGPLSPRQREVVSRIDRNGRRLLALIEDLLVNSRIEAGQLDLARVPCDLVPVVEGVWEAAVVQAQHRDLDLRLDLPEGPVVVEGDPAGLERVVANLLSNAVKFTPDGGRVELVLSVEAQVDVEVPGSGSPPEEVAPTARITVRDNGIGIPRGDHGQVFRRFYRSTAATDRAVPGAGLGLSIVKAVVDGLGGTVAVQSKEGDGSTFTVRLPLARPTGHAG
ncbi:sensor histidine kinase [Pedococcus sp. NPDC057267]|uniref:sensor histidine kinase n=1 Tax=Pedococcus sp. NPDC057267 TaxID=3346077 RepID=UPI00363B4C61